MRMLAGALAPDGGSVIIDGANVWTQPRVARARVGWLPERAPVQSDASVEEFIQWSARMKGVEKKFAAEFAEHAMQSAAARFYERIAADQDGRKEEIAVMYKFLGRTP